MKDTVLKNRPDYFDKYIEILNKELVPAMGCTEPIALAYCGAKAREVLGIKPEHVTVYASGNIIKNVKSVVIPNSNGKKGIEIAVALGVLFGDAGKKLEVLAAISEEQKDDLEKEMQSMPITVKALETTHALDIEVHLFAGADEVVVRVCDTHTGIVLIRKNDSVIFEKQISDEVEDTENEDPLNVSDIFTFAETVDLTEVKEIIERQINYNLAISKEGMTNNYGARIGQIVGMRDDSVRTMALARTAAASDARMGGCEKPVVINSGSGNQGITTSIPVIVYGEYYKKSHEEILRALLLSNLLTLHLKSGIGRLSSYCGAVSAGVGAGAGIAYLLTKDLRTVNHTIVNAIAISSGIVCDGAKASCAAKIVMAVESGILGFEMFLQGSQLRAGEGLVSKGVENTIHNISKLGHEGMKETDAKIIEIMTGEK
ncbi:MAG: L-serine ammonia-lyase, iron-sulfur-dependent, subunit alpha [Lachnospiraceae bacterium]|nr:L-serine ammonia-lyase, iron-sulfur-dependent, subunit alpha [Lachnospiraceae bacterium]